MRLIPENTVTINPVMNLAIYTPPRSKLLRPPPGRSQDACYTVQGNLSLANIGVFTLGLGTFLFKMNPRPKGHTFFIMKDISKKDIRNNIPLVSRKNASQKTIINIKGLEIGGPQFIVMAGPCTVESKAQLQDIAKNIKNLGAHILRGGAYKPLTFPYRSARTYELREKGLKILEAIKKKENIPIVTEVMDVRNVKKVAHVADILQIGTRNMQNFPLLEEVAKTKKPILLKRHFGASLRDWLGAAEYILYHGNPHVILCERGIAVPHTHHPHSRCIVDLQVIPAAKEYTHLPIIVDPSHSTFRRKYVAAIARAACAVGADGIIIDVHPTPSKAVVDPLQALNYRQFGKLVCDLKKIKEIVN